MKQASELCYTDAMKSDRQTSFFRRFFGSRLFLIVAFCILAITSLSYARAYYRDYKVRQNIKDMQAQFSQLEKKKLESIEILQYVKSDAFVEDKARNELNLQKEGEHVVFVDTSSSTEEQTNAESAPSEKIQTQPLKNPVRWWYYFTHKPLPQEE